MWRILSIIITTCLFVQLYGQKEINYTHKSIYKALIKEANINNPDLKEMTLPDAQKTNTLQGKFFFVDGNIKSHIKYLYVGRVNSCRTGGCSISPAQIEKVNYEYFDYFIFFDSSKSVRFVKVFDYQATHGQEITAKGWLKQFYNFDGTTNLEVGKDIDAIAGATISVYAITADIQLVSKQLKNIHTNLTFNNN